ncbi:MAG: hypothetical protein ABI583_00200 [Betaproteobacteria bacterium]
MVLAFLLAVAAAAGVRLLDSLALLPVLVIAWRLAPSALTYAFIYQLFILVLFPDLGAGLANHYQLTGFGWRVLGQLAVGLWALLLAVPGLVAFRWRSDSRFNVRVLAALGAWVVMPSLLSPLMVLHPVQAAGDWLPASGYIGLAVMALFILALAVMPWRVLAPCAVIPLSLSIILNVAYLYRSDKEESKAVIHGLSLSLGRPSNVPSERAGQLRQAVNALETRLRQGAEVVVTPELLVRNRDGSMHAWQRELDRLTRKYPAMVWTGAEVWDREEVFNLAGAAGSDASPVAALVPLPFVMWKPWSGLPSTWSDDNRWRRLNDREQIGFLFCYEALTPAAWLERLRRPDRPGTLVFLSSQWWASGDAVGQVLSTSARAFARLAGVRYRQAVAR